MVIFWLEAELSWHPGKQYELFRGQLASAKDPNHLDGSPCRATASTETKTVYTHPTCNVLRSPPWRPWAAPQINTKYPSYKTFT